MAVKFFRCFLVCLASTFAVEALECFTKVATECKPKGPICETLETQLVVQGEAQLTCPENKTVCVSISARSTNQGFTVDTKVAGCLAKAQNYGVGCYDRSDLDKIDSFMAKNLADAETQLGIKFDTVKTCLCEGDLCNKATKAALSGARSSCFNLSVIITPILITFVALRWQM